MIFLLLAVAVLFLILSLCLIYPTLRWSYEYNAWRGMLSSLLFVSFAPAALVVWYCCMQLDPFAEVGQGNGKLRRLGVG